MSWQIINADCIAAMKELPDVSVDACVTDPPYELGFMGKGWDATGIANSVEMWSEVFRVLKPGGHVLSFSGTRTYHRMVCAVEDAGFEIRDQIAWMFGSGFPKSLDVSKAIDKRRDDTVDVRVVCRWLRERIDHHPDHAIATIAAHFDFHPRMVEHWAARDTDSQPSLPTLEQWDALRDLLGFDDSIDAEVLRLNLRKGEPGEAWADRPITGEVEEWADRSNYALTSADGFRRDVPASAEAIEWQGWGTALKPAFEPIVVARKPLIGTVAANVLEHGTGAVNVDGCRVQTDDELHAGGPLKPMPGDTRTGAALGIFQPGTERDYQQNAAGRWPANVVLDPEAGAMLDEQTGERGGSGKASGPSLTGASTSVARGQFNRVEDTPFYGDTGGASRFFYCAKTSRAERNAGLEGFQPQAITRYGEQGQGPEPQQTPRIPVEQRNVHPTVKPIALMRWLCRLVTPPGGTILDPFNGSGSTGCAAVLEAFEYIGIEREPDYVAIAEARIKWWAEHPEGVEFGDRVKAEGARRAVVDSGQLDMFGEAA